MLGFGGLRRRVLGIPATAVSFDRRGFHVGLPAARQQLEASGGAFVTGYNSAMRADEPAALAAALGAVERELHGFAFEGAAMALALLDRLTPWRRDRLAAFLEGAGAPHVYMVHIGAGWALARLHRDPLRLSAGMDPLLRWLVVDGYGFHAGFFAPGRHLAGGSPADRFTGYARRAFDLGLGRCLWFAHCADVAVIPAAVARFDPSRQGDLWSGLGLACTYAGAVDRQGLAALRAAAGPFVPHLAQGAAFAAKARLRAGNPTAHMEVACRLLCDSCAEDAAAVTDVALEGLNDDDGQPGFETWRQRIQQHYALGPVNV